MRTNLIFGPAMIPNKKMFRNSNNIVAESHYVFFDVESIEKIREKFHKNNFDNKVNINHNGIQVDGVLMTQSFLINDDNRTTLPEEFRNLPNGTWMIEYEVKNEKVWEKIKDKKLNGFSVEGLFKYSL